MVKSSAVEFSLAIDGLYYKQAVEISKKVESLSEEFSNCQNQITNTNRVIDSVSPEDPEGEDRKHDLCVELDRHWQSFDRVATEIARAAATVHILCTAVLEAHINICADRFLSRRSLEEFDKLSVAGKWLFYPQLKGIGHFDAGAMPFQDFQTLVRRRNALVHYKVRIAQAGHPYELPSLLDEFGLTHREVSESLRATETMVTRLAEMEGLAPPAWIDPTWCSAFTVKW